MLTSMPGLLQTFPYFLCGGKESKCCPAQGRRKQTEKKARKGQNRKNNTQTKAPQAKTTTTTPHDNHPPTLFLPLGAAGNPLHRSSSSNRSNNPSLVESLNGESPNNE